MVKVIAVVVIAAIGIAFVWLLAPLYIPGDMRPPATPVPAFNSSSSGSTEPAVSPTSMEDNRFD